MVSLDSEEYQLTLFFHISPCCASHVHPPKTGRAAQTLTPVRRRLGRKTRAALMRGRKCGGGWINLQHKRIEVASTLTDPPALFPPSLEASQLQQAAVSSCYAAGRGGQVIVRLWSSLSVSWHLWICYKALRLQLFMAVCYRSRAAAFHLLLVFRNETERDVLQTSPNANFHFWGPFNLSLAGVKEHQVTAFWHSICCREDPTELL